MAMQRLLFGLLATVLCAGGATQVMATPALSFASSSNADAQITSTRGYAFDVLPVAGVTVTALGVFDNGADGRFDSHDVGIWDSAGNLLVWATVPAGTAAPLDLNNLFRLVDVPDLVLPQGTGYVVGALFLAHGGDLQASSLGGLTTASSINYDAGRFINNDVAALSFPTETLGVTGLPGGSFEVASTVPEPAALTLFGGSLLGLGWLRRKRT